MILSIDQNSNPLWDTLAKLDALAAAGETVTHCVEDIDVAFTDLGARVNDPTLRLCREQFHPSGGQSWGASLFYSDFLGRLPFEPREFLASLGLSLRTVSRQLDLSAAKFYDRYAQSDTWILVGSSFLFDRNHHRLLGDLGAEEVRPHLDAILDLAQKDTLARFPAADCRARTDALFTSYRSELDALYSAQPRTLAELYRRWMTAKLPATAITLSSEHMALGRCDEHLRVLELFTRHYDLAAGLYNRAVAEVPLGVHPIDIDAGELPFYAILRRDGRMVRCECSLDAGELCFGDCCVPLGKDGALDVATLAQTGVVALCGKAVLLVLQTRLLPGGMPLALPDHGSIYMPVAHRFAALVAEAGLLPDGLAPIVRVHFHLLDRLGETKIPITLPEHLQRFTGLETLPAKTLASDYRQWIDTANDQITAYRQCETLPAMLRRFDAKQTAQLDVMRNDNRQLAQDNPKSPELRTRSQAIRQSETTLLGNLIRHLTDCQQTAELQFYNSRGSIAPWCIAAGGEAFYRDVIAQTTFTRE